MSFLTQRAIMLRGKIWDQVHFKPAASISELRMVTATIMNLSVSLPRMGIANEVNEPLRWAKTVVNGLENTGNDENPTRIVFRTQDAIVDAGAARIAERFRLAQKQN